MYVHTNVCTYIDAYIEYVAILHIIPVSFTDPYACLIMSLIAYAVGAGRNRVRKQ